MKFEFDAKLENPMPNMETALFSFPYNAWKSFGSRAIIPIRGSIDGVSFRSSLTPMGGANHCMVVNKTIRTAIGKKAGDTVHIILEKDEEKRVVKTPDSLKYLLEKAGLLEEFQKFSYTHQKEYVDWINDAKKQETRDRRLSQALQMIRSKSHL